MPFYKHTHRLRASRPAVEIHQYVSDYEQAKAVARWANGIVGAKNSLRFLNPPWEQEDLALSATLRVPDAPLFVAAGAYLAYENETFYTLSAEQLARDFAPVPDPA